MRFDAHCIACLVKRQFEMALEHNDRQAQTAFMKDILKGILDAPEDVSAPYLVPAFTRAYAKHFGVDDPYEKIKKDSNDRVLQILPQIRAIVESADDPLLMALKFSRTGNFLDFATLPADVIERELREGLEKTPSQGIDEEEYRHFLADMQSAKQMLILCDNAGEIVFDLLLVEQIKKAFPALCLQYVVRGGNAQNDATMEDAVYVGMDKLVPVFDNGCDIPGTELAYCSEKLQDAFRSADLILAKGQGNFESLIGCNYNVYYIFLCKCIRICEILDKPMMMGMFLNELRIPNKS